jgi:hypothetical protein
MNNLFEDSIKYNNLFKDDIKYNNLSIVGIQNKLRNEPILIDNWIFVYSLHGSSIFFV